MSNRSKIGSLEASRRLLEVRPLKKHDPKMMMMNDSITITQQLRRGVWQLDCRKTTQEPTTQTLDAVVIETGVGFPAGI